MDQNCQSVRRLWAQQPRFWFIRKSEKSMCWQLEQPFRIVNRNCEVEILSIYKGGAGNTNDFPGHVEQGTTAAAMRDGCSDLQKSAFLVTSNSADDAV